MRDPWRVQGVRVNAVGLSATCAANGGSRPGDDRFVLRLSQDISITPVAVRKVSAIVAIVYCIKIANLKSDFFSGFFFEPLYCYSLPHPWRI